MSDFIPHTDQGALNWMKIFSQGITAAPAKYMLTAADATAIANAVNAYAAAYATHIDPATSTPVALSAKNTTRAAAEAVCRQYASLIKPNAGITDEDKIAIGVPPINHSRTPVPAPATAPLLNVMSHTPGVQTVRFADATTPDSAAKPHGAASLQLFLAVADNPVFDPSQTEFHAAYSRNGIRVEFDAGQRGKTATYFARWAGVRGDVGPWSSPAFMMIAA